jgi:type III restriction enzyme
MNDPYAVPANQPQSPASLVASIREHVDAWRRDGYPGSSATTRRLLEHWFLDEHQTPDGRPFRYFFTQREATETLIYLYEVAKQRTLASMAAQFASLPVAVSGQPYPRYAVKAATGSGKTKVMSLLVAWSYFHRLREANSELTTNSLIVAPNLIVFERLRADFEHGAIFYNDPVLPPEWRGDFNLAVCLRDEPIPVAARGVLVLSNIQVLYERQALEPANPIDALLGAPPRDPPTPEPVPTRLARRGRVLVVNDEAHHLHDAIQRDTKEPLTIWQTLYRLHELSDGGITAQLDFSATPRNQEGRLFDEVVVDYLLSQAIDDGIVKRPVIGELTGQFETTSNNAAVRYRQRIGAGVAKWREFRDTLTPAGRKPLLFVMAEDTKAADEIAAYLETLTDLAGRVLTIHVNMTGPNRGEIARADLEKARTAAREVDRDDNPYCAIVIVPLRPYTAAAKILPEQTLGRGLRRMTPPGSGVDEQVVVIEHEAFRRLWDAALDEEGLRVERCAAADVHPEASVIAVEPDRLLYDIEIPQPSRVLHRSAAGLVSLRPEDVPALQVPLAEELHSEIVNYTGRDLRSEEIVERAEYEFPVADQPGPIIAWFADELARETGVVGQFALLAALVKGYLERRAFGEPAELANPVVLQALREPAARETVLRVLAQAVNERTLAEGTVTTEPKPLLLSRTRPFLWSRQRVTAKKSVFSAQPCDSGLEVRFCEFLDRSSDVDAFAKLAHEVRFSLEYRGEGGRLAYYYPDFAVRLADGDCMIVETKGLVDVDVPGKDARVLLWASDASATSGVRWSYLRVDENLFDRHAAQMQTVRQLIALVFEVRRQDYLQSLPAPRRRTPEEVIALMDKISEQMEGVTGIDDELSRLRDDPRS